MKSIETLLKAVKLSEPCKQMILGGFLGDSSLSIHKKYRNARYQFRHSMVQEEYFLWKFRSLYEIAPKKPSYGQKPDGASKNLKINFMSKALPSLTAVYNIICPKGKNLTDLNNTWLGYLNEPAVGAVALLVWWLDDGSIIGKGKRGVFCCEGFSLETIQLFKEYLKKRWGLESTIGRLNKTKADSDQQIQYTKSVYYRLYLNNTELRKLFGLIMPLLETPSLLRKFNFRYKDPIERQRWISTMKESLPQFHAQIELL